MVFPAMKGEPEIGTQVGPCGIICISCPLGSGIVAETAGRTMVFIEDCKISEWAPFVSEEGGRIDWDRVVEGLEWMKKYAVCAGCESGGGPPNCTIRVCAMDKGLDICSSCDELDSCDNFDWLEDHGEKVKDALKKSRGMSKEEYIKSAEGKMPWED
jgi:hypothetical protein